MRKTFRDRIQGTYPSWSSTNDEITLSNPVQFLSINITLVPLRSKSTSYTLVISSPNPPTTDLHTNILKELSQHKNPKSFNDFLVPPQHRTKVNNRLSYYHTNRSSQSRVEHVLNSSVIQQVNSQLFVVGQAIIGDHGINPVNPVSPSKSNSFHILLQHILVFRPMETQVRVRM